MQHSVLLSQFLWKGPCWSGGGVEEPLKPLQPLEQLGFVSTPILLKVSAASAKVSHKEAPLLLPFTRNNTYTAIILANRQVC